MNLTLCKDDHQYVGGDTLECRWRIHPPRWKGSAAAAEVSTSDPIEEIEISVMWYTEGKGDEDFKVHYFRRYAHQDVAQMDLCSEQVLSTKLPYSPLSYEGQLLRIRWCVRLRIFAASGSEVVAQHPFQLVAPPCGDF
ncbi:hypothetical protein FF011L_42210 [Roseimaritima multifibrata]|uniref:Uncharacterized protein n=1 Tax=Roseimaritima multifibrata TaxID=1930274 RepID=A0A517MKK9_9BACT|nr:hypothetical protein FF011L_42210 [Roseimaritima multifibrata]